MNGKAPKPEEFPITFERALRLAVGGRDVPERFRIFRAWWKASLLEMSKRTGSPIQDNTDEVVAMFRRGVDSSWLNNMCAGIKEFKKAQVVEQCRTAANARWSKSKLDSPKRRKK